MTTAQVGSLAAGLIGLLSAFLGFLALVEEHRDSRSGMRLLVALLVLLCLQVAWEGGAGVWRGHGVHNPLSVGFTVCLGGTWWYRLRAVRARTLSARAHQHHANQRPLGRL